MDRQGLVAIFKPRKSLYEMTEAFLGKEIKQCSSSQQVTVCPKINQAEEAETSVTIGLLGSQFVQIEFFPRLKGYGNLVRSVDS